MKGMIFCGCSFTWGQGLYFYSDLPRIVKPTYHHVWDVNWVTNAQLQFKNTIRFPRLVANHFNTFEVVANEYNGGNNFSILQNIRDLFVKQHNDKNFFYYDEIDYIIIQITQINRGRVDYEHISYESKEWFLREFDINHYLSNASSILFFHQISSDQKKQMCDIMSESTPDTKYNERDLEMIGRLFVEWCCFFSKDKDRGISILCEEMLDMIKRDFIFYESQGIKTLVLVWENNIINLLKKDGWFRKRHIPLLNEGVMFDSIESLMEDDKSLYIMNDSELPIVYNDDHPSKRCHEIISNSVIHKIVGQPPTKLI